MFTNQRYLSSSVDDLPLKTPLFLWHLIDSMPASVAKAPEQFFDLSVAMMNGKPVQRIEHYQKIPAFEQVVFMETDGSIFECKLTACDTGTISLLARE